VLIKQDVERDCSLAEKRETKGLMASVRPGEENVTEISNQGTLVAKAAKAYARRSQASASHWRWGGAY